MQRFLPTKKEKVRTGQAKTWQTAKKAFVAATGLEKKPPILVKVPVIGEVERSSTGITRVLTEFEKLTVGETSKEKLQAKLDEFRRIQASYLKHLAKLAALPPAPAHLKENAAWKATYIKSLKILEDALEAIEATLVQLVESRELYEKKVDAWTQQAALVRERLKATLLRGLAVVRQVKSQRTLVVDVNATNNQLSTAARDVAVSLSNLKALNARGYHFPLAPDALLAYLDGWHKSDASKLRPNATLADRDAATDRLEQVLEQIQTWAGDTLGMQ